MSPEFFELIKAYGIPGFAIALMLYTLYLNNKHALNQRAQLEAMEEDERERNKKIEDFRIESDRKYVLLQDQFRTDLTRQRDEALKREGELQQKLTLARTGYEDAERRLIVANNSLRQAQSDLNIATAKLNEVTANYSRALGERDDLQRQIHALRDELTSERAARIRAEEELKNAMQELKKDTQTIIPISSAELSKSEDNGNA